MKCLVTGGSGFLGSHVADELTRRGHKVTIFDRKLSKWKKFGQKMITGDLLNYNFLEKAIKGKDIIFHFAALSDLSESLYQPVKTITNNILGTVYTLELCRKHKIRRFIHASTIYVNSDQGGFYRSSKKAAEDYVEEYQKRYSLDFTILRFGSLYGNRSNKNNGVRQIVDNALKNKEVSYIGTNKTIREYIHIKDAAKATVDALKNKYKNQHIVITGKSKIKLPYFLRTLSKLLKIKKEIRFKNKKILGHYVLSPHTYVPIKGKKFNIKSGINFKKGLKNLVRELKNNKKL
tara:strand:- start:401 stop:1273 length:873 start_codon:yes stop_codon:yes gene_type:complete